MASFNKFQQFVSDVAAGVHASGLVLNDDVFKIYLTNATPSASADAVKADLAEITAENGYSAGGVDVQNVAWVSGGVLSVSGTDVQIEASGGTIGPFRYVVLYNDTPTDPTDPLIGWWDYQSNLTLQDGETFTVDFGATLFTIS